MSSPPLSWCVLCSWSCLLRGWTYRGPWLSGFHTTARLLQDSASWIPQPVNCSFFLAGSVILWLSVSRWDANLGLRWEPLGSSGQQLSKSQIDRPLAPGPAQCPLDELGARRVTPNWCLGTLGLNNFPPSSRFLDPNFIAQLWSKVNGRVRRPASSVIFTCLTTPTLCPRSLHSRTLS